MVTFIAHFWNLLEVKFSLIIMKCQNYKLHKICHKFITCLFCCHKIWPAILKRKSMCSVGHSSTNVASLATFVLLTECPLDSAFGQSFICSVNTLHCYSFLMYEEIPPHFQRKLLLFAIFCLCEDSIPLRLNQEIYVCSLVCPVGE